jgi:hypothetical protein
MDSTWLRDEGVNILEFDVFCPAEESVQLSPDTGGGVPGGPQPNEIQKVGPGESGAGRGTEGRGEGTL